MSDPTTPSLDQLPLEVLHRIFYHLDVSDIVRLRSVSRYLNEATYCKNVWSDAYRTADFVRPQGPFPSQSAHDLEHVLVAGFRTDQNFRRRHRSAEWERPRPTRRIRYSGMDIGAILVFGQFLLIAFKDQLRCYYLSLRNLRASIIWRPTEGGVLREFDCVTSVDGEGHSLACVALNEEIQTTKYFSIYLLKEKKKSRVTLELLHQFEHDEFSIFDAVKLGPRMIVIQSQQGRDVVAMDVRTRTLFRISCFNNAMMEAVKITEDTFFDGAVMPTSISTSTHLVLASSYCFRDTGEWKTFFQAFSLPPLGSHVHSSSTTTPISLRPSHSGIILGIQIASTVLLHDSILDPATQDTLISIAVRAFEYPTSSANSNLKHGILRLHNAPTSRDREVGTITFQLLGSLGFLGQLSRPPFLYPSLNGTGRVFYTHESGSRGTISMLEYNLRPDNDDGAQDGKIVQYPSLLQFPAQPRFLDYDPYSCRICVQPAMMYDTIDIYELGV